MMENLDDTPGIEEKRRRRGIYILPSLFTTANLFAGFYAIVQAMNGSFEYAPLAIFIAMILDALDGRIARLTHTESDFGAQYDSLVDMVSFGPARLRARSTPRVDRHDKRFSRALPGPAPAPLVVAFVGVLPANGVPGRD